MFDGMECVRTADVANQQLPLREEVITVTSLIQLNQRRDRYCRQRPAVSTILHTLDPVLE